MSLRFCVYFLVFLVSVSGVFTLLLNLFLMFTLCSLRSALPFRLYLKLFLHIIFFKVPAINFSNLARIFLFIFLKYTFYNFHSPYTLFIFKGSFFYIFASQKIIFASFSLVFLDARFFQSRPLIFANFCTSSLFLRNYVWLSAPLAQILQKGQSTP